MSLGRSISRLPSVPRRMAAGAWHVLAGFGFLLRHASLWPLAVVPAVLAVLGLFLGLALGAFIAPHVETYLVPSDFPTVLRFLLTWLLWTGLLAAGLAVGFAAALVVAAPVLDRLSRRVESFVRGSVVDRSRGTRWEALQAVRGALFFLVAAVLVLPLELIPVVGPFLAALWAAHALAFQQTEAPLTRRGLDFFERRQWHRYWRAETMGFGLLAILALVVPLANFLLAPALAVGATRLVLEIEGGRGTAERRSEAPPDRLSVSTQTADGA